MNPLSITKRTGEVVPFDVIRITRAIEKAAVACARTLSEKQVSDVVSEIVTEINGRFVEFYPNVENIQDIVEKYLMKHGHYEIAKEYILYREKRNKAREQHLKQTIEKSRLGKLTIQTKDNKTALFDNKKIHETLRLCTTQIEQEVDLNLVSKELIRTIYDGISTNEIEKALILASVALTEHDPAYDTLASRLFLRRLYKQVTGVRPEKDTLQEAYRTSFKEAIRSGVKQGIFDTCMQDFDLNKLAYALKISRDDTIGYMGLQTLHERYFIKSTNTNNKETLLELPQTFFMRVAMGLAQKESDKVDKAIEFYEVLSSLRFLTSTPTLFHAGTTHPQLSSCYLTTVEDDLNHIFKCLGDNAQLSKWSGGLGNDWTNIRATGARITSTGVESQGLIPFLKIANDVTAAINRSGKRRGATCAYLETWHLDIEEFLDLRRNTGDERRRTHDMNTANWIPDLFMKRVQNDETWTLFSPEEVSDLHHLYGSRFEKKYVYYEECARNGKLSKHKVVSAKKLWRKMLSMLFETGHPWITFKDPCNIRSPQDHVGTVHCSNLCTEITLNTSAQETAVCNLGSVNLAKHITPEGNVHKDLLAKTIRTAMRMLDNVIDLNFYPTTEAEYANKKHRPVGLGMMGFQDALFLQNISFDSHKALQFADTITEFISFHALLASSTLAKERGCYQSYEGSKWHRGLLPIDTVSLLEEERGESVDVSRDVTMDWDLVRDHIRLHGMRNSNTMALAPTATIATIAGCYPTIEPMYKNMYVKANMSGEFTIMNAYLVRELKQLALWTEDMRNAIKYHDGSIQHIPEIPAGLKTLYKEAFEIDPVWCVTLTATRQKWIDQSQSHNVFMRGTSGTQLSNLYFAAWRKGLKTTYYLRTLAATQIEKSTLDAQQFGYTQKRTQKQTQPAGKEPLCKIEDPACEACQ